MKITKEQRSALLTEIDTVLSNANGKMNIDYLRASVTYSKRGSGLTKLIHNHYQVVDGIVSKLPDNNTDANKLCLKMARAIDRMAKEIEALQNEVKRLRQVKSVPTLSPRAVAALAVYGD